MEMPLTPIRGFDGFDLDGFPQLCEALRSPEFLEYLGSEPLRFNQLAHVPCAGSVPLRQNDVERVREALGRYSARHNRPGWKAPATEVIRAIALVSRERPFHPVADYLAPLRWDGEARLDRLAPEVFDVDRSALACATPLIRKWWVAAVARAFDPGCSVHGMLVLLGGGSWPLEELLRLLVPRGLYSDVPVKAAGPGHSPFRRAWLYACHDWEVRSLRVHSSAFSAWLSASDDEVTGPFAAPGERAPRTTVFAAAGEVLPSQVVPALARRLWGVPVGLCPNPDKLEAWRDQLWAEAVSELRKGSAWTLDHRESLRHAAAARFLGEPDPWMEHVLGFVLGTRRPETDQILGHLTEILVADRPKERPWSPWEKKRVFKVLRMLGYVPDRSTDRDGLRARRWVPTHLARSAEEAGVPKRGDRRKG